jgi:O-acetyl-ADP-ribose deacetylase (regulator of RNase III)
MGTFTEIKGDLFSEIFKGQFDIVCQGNNCFNVQGGGIALMFVKYFNTDKFSMELTGKGDFNKLGQIDYQKFTIKNGIITPFVNDFKDSFNVTVCNCYTQFNYGMNHFDGIYAPFDEDAFTLCMKKVNKIFKGKKIGLPAIGAGLAGGNLETIKNIMKKQLKDCDVTLVLL